MRIAHIGDTHLGHVGTGIQRDVPDPFRPGAIVKQQEADILSGFAAAVDLIIEKVRPALVIHSGDLFDTAQPNAAVLDFAMQQFARLYQAGIPSVVVEGDHSCPRTRSYGNVIRMLRCIPGVTVVCPQPDRIRCGPFSIHAVPHQALDTSDHPVTPDQIEAGQINVLVAHGVADNHRLFKTHKVASPIAIERVTAGFDYVALGHCHRFAQVPQTENAFYSGTTAMVFPLDFRPSYTFGFNVVSFNGERIKVEREAVPTRQMRHYGLDNAEGLSAREVIGYLERQASALDSREAYCRVVIENMDPLARREMSYRAVAEIFVETAGIDIIVRPREIRWEATAASRGLVGGGSPEARFGELVRQMDGDDVFKSSVLAKGTALLETAAAKVLEVNSNEENDT